MGSFCFSCSFCFVFELFLALLCYFAWFVVRALVSLTIFSSFR
jgi:hypothetical protein